MEQSPGESSGRGHHHNSDQATNSAPAIGPESPSEMAAEPEEARIENIRSAWRRENPKGSPPSPRPHLEYHIVQSVARNLLAPFDCKMACSMAKNTTIPGDEALSDNIQKMKNLSDSRGGTTQGTTLWEGVLDATNLAIFRRGEVISRIEMVLGTIFDQLLFRTHWKGTEDERWVIEKYLELTKEKSLELDRLLRPANAAKRALHCFKAGTQTRSGDRLDEWHA